MSIIWLNIVMMSPSHFNLLIWNISFASWNHQNFGIFLLFKNTQWVFLELPLTPLNRSFADEKRRLILQDSCKECMRMLRYTESAGLQMSSGIAPDRVYCKDQKLKDAFLLSCVLVPNIMYDDDKNLSEKCRIGNLDKYFLVWDCLSDSKKRNRGRRMG